MEEINTCTNCRKILKEYQMEVKALKEIINKIVSKHKEDWNKIEKFLAWNDCFGYNIDEYNKIKKLIEKQLKEVK